MPVYTDDAVFKNIIKRQSYCCICYIHYFYAGKCVYIKFSSFILLIDVWKEQNRKYKIKVILSTFDTQN